MRKKGKQRTTVGLTAWPNPKISAESKILSPNKKYKLETRKRQTKLSICPQKVEFAIIAGLKRKKRERIKAFLEDKYFLAKRKMKIVFPKSAKILGSL